MPQSSFVVQVSDWVSQSQARIDTVFKESAGRVVSIMQTTAKEGGAMAVDTGFLRASIRVTFGAPTFANVPQPRPKPEKGSIPYDDKSVDLSIAGAPLGETIFVTYGANYAGHVEYGTSKMQGRGFVRLAAMQWPVIVAEVSAELKTRIEAP